MQQQQTANQIDALMAEWEAAQRSLNIIESYQGGEIPVARYNRLLNVAVRRSEAALDAVFAGRDYPDPV